MVTTVNTGGMKRFVYGKDYNPKNTPEQDAVMDEAWVKAKKRMRNEKIIRWTIVGVIIIAIILYYLFKK